MKIIEWLACCLLIPSVPTVGATTEGMESDFIGLQTYQQDHSTSIAKINQNSASLDPILLKHGEDLTTSTRLTSILFEKPSLNTNMLVRDWKLDLPGLYSQTSSTGFDIETLRAEPSPTSLIAPLPGTSILFGSAIAGLAIARKKWRRPAL